jgi:hypothetical protein
LAVSQDSLEGHTAKDDEHRKACRRDGEQSVYPLKQATTQEVKRRGRLNATILAVGVRRRLKSTFEEALAQAREDIKLLRSA